MKYKWRLIRCFSGSFEKYFTRDEANWTDEQAWLANKILTDNRLHWVR